MDACDLAVVVAVIGLIAWMVLGFEEASRENDWPPLRREGDDEPARSVAPPDTGGVGSLEGAGDARRCRLLRAAWAVAGLVALLAVLVLAVLVAVDAHADRRRQWTTYGSARGRLVVACDMTSDTCSDGRKITTTRSTPVPCEVSPGVWEMVPEDTGCYSVRGLESWAATTSYLSYGAELDRSPWLAVDGATVQSLPTGGYRVSGTGGDSRIMQPYIPSVPGPHTLSCIARSVDETPQARMRIYWDASSPGSVAIPVTAEWAVHSITATVPEEWEGNISIHVYSRTGTVDVIGCWLTRTSTPGRACWGGEAPVTCAADRHTISTEGWSTESGEICVSFVPGPRGELKWVFDGRSSTITGATRIILRNVTNRLEVLGAQGDLAGPTLDEGQAYTACVKRDAGQVSLILDGEVVASAASANPFLWAPEAGIGGSTLVSTQRLDGSIRSLTVRSFE